MQATTLIRWNLGLLAAIGVYGLVTDEPYWREVGHGPWLYDYFYWVALAVNGPSGFLADYLSWFTGTHSEQRYGIQYALWGLLLWPQWRLYNALALWSHRSRRHKLGFYALVTLVIVLGAIAACQAWIYGHRPTEMYVDRYFWFVRVAGLACAGLVMLTYAQLTGQTHRFK